MDRALRPRTGAGAPPASASAGGGRSGFWRFWSTLPGILTGLAALVGAVAGVVVLFRDVDDEHDAPVTPPSVTSPPATVPPPVEPPSMAELNLPAPDDTAAANQRLIDACAAGDLRACGRIQEILADECFQGIGVSCDVLFVFSAPGGDVPAYGATCGNRVDRSFAGQCQFL